MAQWVDQLKQRFAQQNISCEQKLGEVTIEVEHSSLLDICRQLRDADEFHFEQLIDLCGIDYSEFGNVQWETEQASSGGFSRGISQEKDPESEWTKPRFAVVYHLLSISNNRRLRLRCFVPDKTMMIPSVNGIWSSANWYEREAFDLFGIRFDGHDDLRRILTDYGFVGHPFRKDFPLIGNLEMRYDATEKRCIYEPVSIEPRILVPRVIRHDARYDSEQEG